MKVISTEKLPIKLWLGTKEDGEIDIEDGALEQARNLANLPFAFKHVSIMPDTHEGYGMYIDNIAPFRHDVGVVLCNDCIENLKNESPLFRKILELEKEYWEKL